MARIDKLERARQEGMSYALEVAKKKGIEGLEEELRMRGITGIPIGVSRSAVDKAVENVKNQTLDTVNILTAMTLHDEFGFGAARIERFRKRFDFKTECLMEDYVTWLEMIDALKKETGLEYAIRMNDKDVKHKEPARKQAVPYASRQHRRNTERSAKRIARKEKKPDAANIAWQYTSSGRFPKVISTGNSGNFDLNVVYKEPTSKKVEETKKTPAKTKTVYYPKYRGKSSSIVDALKSLKINSSKKNREKIATLNGIKNYKGGASQNTKLINLLKRGKLIKSK